MRHRRVARWPLRSKILISPLQHPVARLFPLLKETVSGDTSLEYPQG